MIENNKNLVSILVPYYKGKDFVEEAIVSATQQTYKNIEIIVINDSPEDEESTNYIIDLQKKYHFKLIHHKHNMGLTKVMMTGFENSNGDYIELLSQDDLYLPDKTEKQLKIFEENKDIVYVSGLMEIHNVSKNTHEITDISETLQAMKSGEIFPALYKACVFNGFYAQAAMVKREIIKKDFTPLWAKLTADVWPIKIMLFEKYPNQIYLQNEVVTIYRIHNDNTVKNPYKMLALNVPTVAEMIPEEYRREALYGILRYVNLDVEALNKDVQKKTKKALKYKKLLFTTLTVFAVYFAVTCWLFMTVSR